MHVLTWALIVSLGAGGKTALMPLADSASRDARSLESRHAVSLRFENETAGEVAVEWVDSKGVPKDFGSIPAHTARAVRTYATHVWVVRDATGRPLETYVVGSKDATAVIQPRLMAQATESLGTVRSTVSTVRAVVRFVNRTGGAVKLYWLDSAGERQFRAEVQSDQALVVDTFATNPWVAVDAQGNPLGVFVAQPGSSEALLQRSAP